MAESDPRLALFDRLTLTRVGSEGPAGLCIASLPLPRGGPQDLALSGRPTYVKPLGHWPGTGPPRVQPHGGSPLPKVTDDPRRLLLIADNSDTSHSPTMLGVTRGVSAPPSSPPMATAEVFADAGPENLELMYWERSLLQLEWGGRSMGIAMGMRVRGEVHWWEYCNLVTLAESPHCREVEMGGTIPHERTSPNMIKEFEGRDNPWIHKHNWLNAYLYARLHANGVCEIYARHTNAYFVDDGCDLKEAVPVVGFRFPGGDEVVRPLLGAWDGSRQGLEAGGVKLDLTECARLATPNHPGKLDSADGFLVWQPYQGVDVFGGPSTLERTGDSFFWRAEEQVIPRGMSRTLRFSLSLNPARSPRVARYLAPSWWYGLCEEFLPEPLLPVSNEFDATIDSARRWFHKYMVKSGFDEGVIPNEHTGDPAERHTPAAEGDVSGVLYQIAYKTGDPLDYDCATRASYCFHDVFIDHAAKRVRYQGLAPHAFALPLARVQSCIATYLENGDQFLINTAQAVIDTAYSWHKNSWPRRAVGRDARVIHSAILMYRFFGDEHYLALGRDFIADVGAAQWPNGAFGDQGGGAGVHGHAAYITKAWMGWLATFGVLDYLELVPDDARAIEIVRKFAEWLMSEAGPRNEGKAYGWTYMHDFKGKQRRGATLNPGPTVGRHHFHMEYIARLLPFWSLRTGDTTPFDSYMRSHESAGVEKQGGYWHGTAIFSFLPWLQMKLWNATVTAKGVEADPTWFGPRTPVKGVIHTPDGPVEMTWRPDGTLDPVLSNRVLARPTIVGKPKA